MKLIKRILTKLGTVESVEFTPVITGITIDKKEIDKFIKGVTQFMLAEAEVLNSGVMVKDGTVWHNLN